MNFPVLWRVIWREYLIYSLIFTFIAAWIVFERGITGLPAAFWLKVAGAVSIMGYIHLWRSKYLFLFYNLGYGRRHVIMLFLAFDLILSGNIFLVAFLLKNESPA